MTASAGDVITPRRPPPWNDPRVRGFVLQVAVIAAVAAAAAYLIHNTLVNMARQGIATGFSYLGREASFEIGEALIQYSPADSYGRALLVGLLNTLLVAALGIVLATILGTLVGVARLSGNWLIRKLAEFYVETLRNVPLLLQLIVWWDVLRVSSPPPRQAWEPLPDVFVSVRGIAFPVPVWGPVYGWVGAAAIVTIVAWAVLARRARKNPGAGRRLPSGLVPLSLFLAVALALFLTTGTPLALDRPVLKAFNFSGGASVTPEFAALLFGLTAYTAAFIAEIVRSGIEGVGRGQSEAAEALGLRRGQILRLVIFPQALRIIVPPLLSEYLALTKNSSLAVAIGFPDLMSITNTTLNQTGQAVEAIAVMMAIYLGISLVTSVALNLYNRRLTLAER